MQEIALSPLGLDDVGRLAADALHCEGNSGHPLAQLVHEKSGGNPFFAIQFLTALAEEGLLRFDPDAAAWIWDVEQIRAKGYTDNVADLMVGKLKRLSNTTQDALKRLACLGNEVEIRVRDNGTGIAPEIRDKLFQPFVTTKPTGSGLGLALVAKIVGDHGGIIECESQPRHTVFRVLMPMFTAAANGAS